jgi:dTMP kinase
MHEEDKMTTGRCIAIDGIDGAGKTTQVRLLAGRLSAEGYEVTVVRAPGTTDLGNKLRSILLSDDIRMDAMTQALLFTADRRHALQTIILPALEKGNVVVCDRFIATTLAYQGELGADPFELCALTSASLGGFRADLTIILDAPVSDALARTGKTDRFERLGPSYYQRVSRRFMGLQALGGGTPLGKIHVVNGAGDEAHVHERVLAAARSAWV